MRSKLILDESCQRGIRKSRNSYLPRSRIHLQLLYFLPSSLVRIRTSRATLIFLTRSIVFTTTISILSTILNSINSIPSPTALSDRFLPPSLSLYLSLLIQFTLSLSTKRMRYSTKVLLAMVTKNSPPPPPPPLLLPSFSPLKI